jgi:hypothetical protein
VSSVELVLGRRPFRAIERLVQLLLPHGLRKDYRASDDNRIQRRMQELVNSQLVLDARQLRKEDELNV